MTGVVEIAASVINSIERDASIVVTWPVSILENLSTSLLKRFSISDVVDFLFNGVFIFLANTHGISNR
jgi:hypothetical protein